MQIPAYPGRFDGTNTGFLNYSWSDCHRYGHRAWFRIESAMRATYAFCNLLFYSVIQVRILDMFRWSNRRTLALLREVHLPHSGGVQCRGWAFHPPNWDDEEVEEVDTIKLEDVVRKTKLGGRLVLYERKAG
jgi:hypothetical protein